MNGPRAAAISLALLGGGCSLILSTAEPSQCTTSADCDANPALVGRECREGFCVPRPGPPDGLDAGPKNCANSTLCTQANDGKASHCAKNGGVCTPWQTVQCEFLSGGDAWKDENALVLGAIFPFKVKQIAGQPLAMPYASRLRKAIDLAVNEVNGTLAGGVVLTTGPRRPIAVVHCDSGLDARLAQDAFQHLTEVVGVEALIIGADDDLVAVTPKAQAKKTALVCSDCIGPFPQNPQAWRIVPPLVQQVPMANWRVGALEAQRKAAPDAPSLVKVAVLTQKGRGEDAFVERFVQTVRFNGLSAQGNGSNFMVVTSEDPRTQSPRPSAHVEELRTFAPDIVVVAMGADFPRLYAPELEATWPSATPRPQYVLTDLSYDVASFVELLGPNSDDLRRRISGTRHAFDPARQTQIEAFEQRWLAKSNKEPPGGNWSAYEAFYALLYAIDGASVNAAKLDGARISTGFERLRAGPSIDVGPGPLNLALALLAEPTGSINLRGLWSELDWNLTTHDLDEGAAMFCFQRTRGFLEIKPDAGPRLATSTGVVSGVYACD